ncbi:hypothetical protein PUNSTDRAFT_129105 [Punctularia strigosozonata HHB-11173 SS5]|uniref:uncharacterized protein n=1 Tax=Punctularia strigosozonata (strain HHB-11173) TaxID=741275 RepID=UPI0004417737|nr:uncharacterized protein PUNSTDRAFT_129105 [Punctularia strigosozonata HHB-11173 SS5]EIN13419.1 hypothetical protein PUNSTDRAFT_129105 [Punctularia strigosozonata HHB-11173 SS5]
MSGSPPIVIWIALVVSFLFVVLSAQWARMHRAKRRYAGDVESHRDSIARQRVERGEMHLSALRTLSRNRNQAQATISLPPPLIRHGSVHSEFNQELPKYTKSSVDAVVTGPVYQPPAHDPIPDSNPPAYDARLDEEPAPALHP